MKKILRAIPAGMVLLPLLCGALLHTFFAPLLVIGSYTTALFSNAGAASLMGLQLFCIGAQIKIRSIPSILKRGGVLFGARLLAGLLVALLYRLFARENLLLGVSVLAAVAAVSNTNGSIYIATTSLMGRREYTACAPVLALTNGPILTLIILGVTGLSRFSLLPLVATVLPMLLGIAVGNLSKSASAFLEPGVSLLLPFIGFALGAGIDLRQAWLGGLAGIWLAAGAILLGGLIAYGMDRLLNRSDGAAGIAASATGANALAVPAAIALANPLWQPYVAVATTQLAAAVVIGALIIPLLAVRFSKRKIGDPEN